MAYRAVAGDFGKGHFRQQPRFEPVHRLELDTVGRIDHRRLFRLQGFELVVEAGQGRLGEPGADLAGVAQLTAGTVMQAQQQCAKCTARTLGISKADDDEFLPMLALELDPVAAAPGHVRRPQPLADQTFHAHLTGTVEQRLRFFFKAVGETQQEGDHRP